jgi:hypothetical protein
MIRAVLLVALAAGAATLTIRGTLRQAFATLVAVTVLVPGALRLHGAVSGYVTIHRVVLAAALFGLALRVRRGEVPASVLRTTPVHVAFLAFLAVALALGVALAAPTTSTDDAFEKLVAFLDQFVFFVAVLAYARAIPEERHVLWIVAGALLAAVAVGVGEYVTGRSWGSLFAAERGVVGRGLGERGGAPRVRGGAEFALAYAWSLALLAPLAVCAAVRHRRAALAPLLLAAAVAGMYFSFTRSAFVGLFLALGLLWLGGRRDRRVGAILALAVVGAGLVYAFSPSLADPFFSERARASARVRSVRLPFVLDLAARDPLTGLGFTGLQAFGIGATDTSYLLLYADLGTVGLATFMVLYVTAIACAGRGIRGADPLPPAAAFGAAVASLVATGSLDLFGIVSTPKAFWLVAALGVAFCERRVGPAPVLRRPTLRRAALVPAGALLGLVVALAAPVRASVTYELETITTAQEAPYRAPTGSPGEILVNTACGLVADLAATLRDARLFCRDDFLTRSPSGGLVRVEAATPAAAERVVGRVRDLLGARLPSAQLTRVGLPTSGRPSWARTAPAWLAVLALGVALLAPAPRLPSRRAARPRRAPAALPEASVAPAR